MLHPIREKVKVLARYILMYNAESTNSTEVASVCSDTRNSKNKSICNTVAQRDSVHQNACTHQTMLATSCVCLLSMVEDLLAWTRKRKK